MSISKATVLVIDDDNSIRSNLVLFLEDEGFEVMTAVSAESALNILGAKRIDVAIVDIRLPRKDGNTLILEAHKVQSSTRFLIHTGSWSYSLPQAVLDLGVRDEHVFRKPLYDMAVLSNAILRLIGEEGCANATTYTEDTFND